MENQRSLYSQAEEPLHTLALAPLPSWVAEEEAVADVEDDSEDEEDEEGDEEDEEEDEEDEDDEEEEEVCPLVTSHTTLFFIHRRL